MSKASDQSEASNTRLKAEIRTLRYALVSAYRSVGLLPYNETTCQLIEDIRNDIEMHFEAVGMNVTQ